MHHLRRREHEAWQRGPPSIIDDDVLNLPCDGARAFNRAADAGSSSPSYHTTRRVLNWLDELFTNGLVEYETM